MNCPDSRGQLTSVLYEGVSIHVCSACKGRLLDEEKLHQIEINREEPIPRDQVHAKFNRLKTSRVCPNCNVGMEKSKYGKYFPLTIDKCMQCQSIWLGEGALEDIQIAYEMHDENTNKKAKQDPKQHEFECPKCGFAQEQRSNCLKCGIYFEKYAAMQAQASQLLIVDNPIPDKQIHIPRGLGTFGVIGFVRDEIKQIPGIDVKPPGRGQHFWLQDCLRIIVGIQRERNIRVWVAAVGGDWPRLFALDTDAGLDS